MKANESRLIIPALMLPLAMVLMNREMFAVTLPSVRGVFALAPDATAWMVTAYSLAFVLSMPLAGRLADAFGRRRVLAGGALLMAVGTVLCLTSRRLDLFVVGRIIQGLGAAPVNPVAMAVLADAFGPERRGRAMGTWSSIGPVCMTAGPLVAGLLIDSVGWRGVFFPTLVLAALSFFVVPSAVPRDTRGARFSLDGTGAFLLAASGALFIFYLSSRPITGVPPLRDLRLLGGAIAAGVLFVWRETRTADPFIPLRMLRYPSFARAGGLAGVRMLPMGTIGVAVPLLLRDIYGRPAAFTGLVLAANAAALLATMRLGGRLADRLSSRPLVVSGFILQAAAMILAGMLGDRLVSLLLALVLQGLGAGLSLAPLHRAALSAIPTHETGLASGLYSMMRFTGTMLASAMVGVVLQLTLAGSPGAALGYLMPFRVAAVGSCAGALIAIGLKERKGNATGS